jgi:peptide deformylase
MQIILPFPGKIALTVENIETIIPEMKEMINFILKRKFIIPGSLNTECLALTQPQISRSPLRFFVLNTDHKDLLHEFRGICVVNPKIVSKNKLSRVLEREGCLSFPFRPMIKVKRYNEIVVSYDIISVKNDLLGKPQLAIGPVKDHPLSGLAARVFQHEFEHLNGKSIFD